MAAASVQNDDAIIIIDSDDDTTEPAKAAELPHSPVFQPTIPETPSTSNSVVKEELPSASSSGSRERDISKDVTEVFRKFTSLCEMCIGKNTDGKSVLMILQKRYKKASKTYTSSRDFRELLETACKKIVADRGNIFVFIKEVVAELRAYRDVTKDQLPQQPTVSQKRQAVSQRDLMKDQLPQQPSLSQKRQAVSQSDSLSSIIREISDVEDIGKSTFHSPALSESLQTRSEHMVPTVVEKLDISVAVVDVANDDKDTTAETSEQHVSAQVVKLERLLEKYSRAIQRYEEKELSLDDLMKPSSDYIIVGKLKARADRIFKQLCSMKGRSYLTGRPLERKFKYTGTRFPEINKKIQSFINKHGSWEERMPDYHDIHKIVCACNTRYNLELTKNRLSDLAAEVFTDVGTMLQQQRHDDFVSSFGSHLTDSYRTSDDPALYDKDLKCQLDTNRARGLHRLDEVINKYASIKEEEAGVSNTSRGDTHKKKRSHCDPSISCAAGGNVDSRTNGDKPVSNSPDCSKSCKGQTPSEGQCTASRPNADCAISFATSADAADLLPCTVVSNGDGHDGHHNTSSGFPPKSSA